MRSVKKSTILLIVSGVLTAGICLVMNLWLMPAIERTTEGLRCFDMNSFGYTFEQAQRFLALLDERGRDLYLHVQLPLDFFYPVAYTAFFMTAICKLNGRATPLLAVPAALAVFDYVENVCTIRMLRAMEVTQKAAAFSSAVTVTKSALMTVTFVMLAALLLRYLLRRRNAKKAA